MPATATKPRRTAYTWADSQSPHHAEALRILGPEYRAPILELMCAEQAEANAAERVRNEQYVLDNVRAVVKTRRAALAPLEQLAAAIAKAKGDVPETEDVEAGPVDPNDPGPVPVESMGCAAGHALAIDGCPN